MKFGVHAQAKKKKKLCRWWSCDQENGEKENFPRSSDRYRLVVLEWTHSRADTHTETLTNSKYHHIPRQLGAHLLHIESVQHTSFKKCNRLTRMSPPKAQNMTKWDFMHSSISVFVHFMQYSDNDNIIIIIINFYMGLNVIPGGPIGPGGPGGPGWPTDPATGGPGGPRAPGIPGVPGSPGQSKHKGHIQSDHRASIWAWSLNHCAIFIYFFFLHA